MIRILASVTLSVSVLFAIFVGGGCVVRDPQPRTVVVTEGRSQPAYVEGGAAEAEVPSGPSRGGGSFCSGGAPCDFTCSRGGCDVECASGSTCASTCSGGNCDQICRSGASCDFTCSGGGCDQVCEPGAACRTSCTGGGCDTVQ
jgi:hypothetical protein